MDYKNGKIYTIRSHQTEQFYIGSTTQPLTKRLTFHKSDYKRYLDGKFNFITSFDIIKFDDCYIELLEEFPCESKMMLHKREGELIRKNNCVNKSIPCQTRKEYNKNHYVQNRDKIKEYKKEYYNNNVNKFLQKHTCECGGKFTYSTKAMHLRTIKHQKFINNISFNNIDEKTKEKNY